jgi:Flp pilus assembly protein TadD
MQNSLSPMPKTFIMQPHAPIRRQTINIWLLSITAMTLFVAGPSLYFWHSFQTGRLAEAFSERAESLLKENKPRAAAEYLQRYLEIKPDNAEIRVRLAEVYDRSAITASSKRRAIELYFQAIGWASKGKLHALRLRVGELLLETEQFSEAEKEARKLLESLQPQEKNATAKKMDSSHYARALRLKAIAIHEQCQTGIWKGSEEEKRSLSDIIEDALIHNPGDRALTLLIAKIYRESPQWLGADKESLTPEERNRQADRYMEEYVSAHPEDPEALLARYTYKSYYRLPDAEADLELALKWGENNLLVLLAKADAEQMAGEKKSRETGRIEDAFPQFDSALKYYRKVLQLGESELYAEKTDKTQSQNDAESGVKSQQPLENWKDIQQYAFVNIGTIQQARGDKIAAFDTWKTGLRKTPKSILLNLLLADALLGLDRTDEVARGYKSKGAEGPLDILETLVEEAKHEANRKFFGGNIEGKLRPQVNALQQTVRLLRGRWHYQRGELQAALPILEEVAKGDTSTPQQLNEALQACILAGNIHLREGRADLAVIAYEDASALDPHAPLPHLAAAQGWEILGRFDLAEKHLRQAMTAEDSPQMRLQLTDALSRLARENSPGQYRLLAMTLGREGHYEEALELCREAATRDASPMPYITAAYAVFEGHPSAKDFELADDFLSNAAETFPDHAELLNVLAALRIHESRLGEAASLLRRVLLLRPGDAMSINNLATVLVERPETLSEGKKLVEQAIVLAGPQAQFLDLEGMIRLAEGKPLDAISLFEKACAGPQPDPRFCFHLAVAYQRAGNLFKAIESMKRARGLEFDRQLLTPRDKKLLTELESTLPETKQ